MRDRASVAIIVAIWLISALIWLRPGITRPDGVGYFAYLPSTYFDHDLVLFNEWQHFGMLGRDGTIASEGLTANGHLADHWTAGSAVVWYPAFIAADIVRAVAPPLQHFLPDGMSLPYNAAAVAASAICGLVTLLAGFVIARRYFAPIAALLATVGTWFGSSLIWYSTREALMAHAVSAALCALVVAASLQKEWLAAGVAAGLAFAVRPQNATFILVPILIALFRHLLPIVGGFILGALPQIVVATVLYGNPLSLYNVAVRTQHSWYGWQALERFWPWQPIFSWYHGLGTWTPLMIAGAAGTLLLFRSHARLASAALLMLVLQWFINASVDRFFWAGSSFGQRRFDNCTIFFLLGLAALCDALPRWLAIVITAAGSLWTMALFFAAQSLDLNRYNTPDQLLNAALHWPKRIDLFESTPPQFKIDVLIVFVATIVVYALVTLLIRARPGAVAGTIVTLIAGWFAFCGLHDSQNMEAWTNVIAKNRQVAPYSGAVRDRLALMRDEEDYLRRTGKAGAAEATAREITEMEKSAAPPASPAPVP